MSSARAENGVDQRVLAVSSNNINTSSHKNINACEPFGMLQSSVLQIPIKNIASSINFNRLPKKPFLARSEMCPISGSLMPSHNDEIPIAMPTNVPDKPIIEVQKNIKKEPMVCPSELYPRPPMP